MTSRQKSILLADQALYVLDLRCKELNRCSATGTKHMVMIAPVKAVLVAGYTIVEGNLIGEATLSKELERTIHSCVADRCVLLAHEAVQLFCGGMVVGR